MDKNIESFNTNLIHTLSYQSQLLKSIRQNIKLLSSSISETYNNYSDLLKILEKKD